MIWLRRYPTLHHLAFHFQISVSSAHRFVHKVLKLIHVHAVPKYVNWPSLQEWNQLAGTVDNWPNVVGFLGEHIFTSYVYVLTIFISFAKI